MSPKEVIPFTAEHAQQLHSLRQWARKQGTVPPSVLNPRNAQSPQALAQDSATSQPTNPSESAASPAPEIPEGSD